MNEALVLALWLIGGSLFAAGFAWLTDWVMEKVR